MRLYEVVTGDWVVGDPRELSALSVLVPSVDTCGQHRLLISAAAANTFCKISKANCAGKGTLDDLQSGASPWSCCLAPII